MKRISSFASILLIFASIMLTSSCQNSNNVKIKSFDLVSLSPDGLRAVNMLVDVGVENPKMGFELSNIKGQLLIDGVECMTFSSDRIIVERKCEKNYMIPLRGELSPGFNPLRLIGYAQTRDFSNLTANISAKVSFRGGLGKTIEKKDLRVGDMINNKLK